MMLRVEKENVQTNKPKNKNRKQKTKNKHVAHVRYMALKEGHFTIKALCSVHVSFKRVFTRLITLSTVYEPFIRRGFSVILYVFSRTVLSIVLDSSCPVGSNSIACFYVLHCSVILTPILVKC